jgi:hypothetical protein
MIALSVVLLVGCRGEVALEVIPGVDACRRCNMVIDRVKQACGYVDAGELVVFDSPGCLLATYDERRSSGAGAPEAVYFTDYRDGSWHPATSTSFLLTEHIPTVMNAGVICFASAEAAEAMRQHTDEVVTDWIGYRTAWGTPDRELELIVRSGTMAPESVEVSKGDLVLLRVRGEGLENDLDIAVTGYPEVGSVTVPVSGEEATLRLMAIRPGSGFPVIDTDSGDALGMMKVIGAHTLDEEEM